MRYKTIRVHWRISRQPQSFLSNRAIKLTTKMPCRRSKGCSANRRCVGEQGKENRWPEDQLRGGAQDAQRPQPTWSSSKRGLEVVTGERLEIERLTSRSEEGRWKSTHRGNSLAAYPTSRTVLNVGREETCLASAGNAPCFGR